MFSSKSYVRSVNDIPTQWILQHYLKLPYKLSGQTFKIKSLFNSGDKDPSMVFYWWKDRYVFKDFSSGKKGSTMHAMMALFNKEFKDTAQQIQDDYAKFLETGSVASTINLDIVTHKWKAISATTRKWNTDDAKYWMSYNINSDLLAQYNIKPLLRYEIARVEEVSGVVLEQFVNETPTFVYGYFREDGSLYKIYRPYWKNKKFFTIDSKYIQGVDQLGDNNYCIIASSMKDLLAIKSLGVKVDIIAPNSENTLLLESTMKKLAEKYDAVITLLDPDKAGIQAMKSYEEKYSIPFAYIPHPDEYDAADIVKKEGKSEALSKIIPPLNSAITKARELKTNDNVVL